MPQPVRGPGRCGKATILWHLNPHPSQGSPGCGPLRPPSPAVAPTLVSPASGPEPQGLRLLRGGQRSALSLSCSTGVNVRRSSRPQPCLHADAVCGVSLGPYESCRKDGFDGPDVRARAGPTAGLQRGTGALPALRVGLQGAGRACGPRHAGPRGRGSAPREAGGVDRRGPWARASTARLLRAGPCDRNGLPGSYVSVGRRAGPQSRGPAGAAARNRLPPPRRPPRRGREQKVSWRVRGRALCPTCTPYLCC